MHQIINRICMPSSIHLQRLCARKMRSRSEDERSKPVRRTSFSFSELAWTVNIAVFARFFRMIIVNYLKRDDALKWKPWFSVEKSVPTDVQSWRWNNVSTKKKIRVVARISIEKSFQMRPRLGRMLMYFVNVITLNIIYCDCGKINGAHQRTKMETFSA